MKYSKVITHGGVFHADEILAIASLLNIGAITSKTPILRVKRNENLKPYLNNPAVLVLDIGLEYNPEMGNFDHHQNSDLEATNILVLRHFFKHKPEVLNRLSSMLFTYVSDIDRGIGNRINYSAGFNGIIKSFYEKDDPQSFLKALSIAQTILDQYVHNIEREIRNELKWRSFTRIAIGTLVQSLVQLI